MICGIIPSCGECQQRATCRPVGLGDDSPIDGRLPVQARIVDGRAERWVSGTAHAWTRDAVCVWWTDVDCLQRIDWLGASDVRRA